MKSFKKITILLPVLFALISCQQTDFEAIPVERLMGDSLIANTTIETLINTYRTTNDIYTDLTRNGTNSGLFTADLVASAADVIIKGVVTSSDNDGNIYKYITIQEPGGRAIKISIDAAGLSALYPLGQRVWVKCNGLYIGNYAQSPQIGTLYYNLTRVTTQTTITYNTVTQKNDTVKTNIYRKEPGRIPLVIAEKAIHAYGMPDPDLIKVDTMTIAEIRAAGESVINKLVCIKNAFFTGRGADFNLPKALKTEELIFAPSTNGVGYPQSREIQDGTGSIFVSTSEYSKFANTKLPSSENRGNITAIVGWYNDKKPGVNPSMVTSEIYHQLTIRSLKDLGKGFEKFHAEIAN